MSSIGLSQSKFIQEVAAPEASKLNQSVMNKKQEDQIRFFPENRL